MSQAGHILKLRQPLRGVRFAMGDASPKAMEPPAPETSLECYERGRAEGERSLSKQLVRQRQEMSELQAGVLKSLREAVPQVVRECEQALTTLTLEMARKLVAGLPVSGEMVEAVIREALSHVEETTEYHLHLHPEDLDLLEGLGSPLLSPKAGAPQFHFHRSPEISRGGCLVKTRFGVVDAQRETKVELLKQSLLA